MPLFFLDRMTTLIVSMVAQIAAMAMTGFMKRMGDFPPPVSYRPGFVQSGQPRRFSADTTML
jgi:hypothetical protein